MSLGCITTEIAISTRWSPCEEIFAVIQVPKSRHCRHDLQHVRFSIIHQSNFTYASHKIRSYIEENVICVSICDLPNNMIVFYLHNEDQNNGIR